MTRPDRDYDEILSRVLHSTLDPIEPAGDGLSKIQRRIAGPWLKRQWSLLHNELTALGWLIFVRCEPFLNEARSSLADFAVSSRRRLRSAAAVLSAALTRAGSGRHQHGAGGDGPASARRRWLGPTVTWLRPALAVAGAVVIVVVGVFTLSNFRETLSPTAAAPRGPAVVGSSHGARNDQGSYGGHTNSRPTSPSGTATSPAGKATTKHHGARNLPQPTPACNSSPPTTPGPSATPTPSPTPSATPSPTPTSNPTSSPTPTNGTSGTSPSQVDTSGNPQPGAVPACV
jgi:hypothetical protein